MPRRSLLALLVLSVVTLLRTYAPAAHADTPLPPPALHTAASPSKAVEAETDPVAGLTTVYRVVGATREKAWSMPGWYRALHVADDGEHLVLGFDGLDLVPRDAPDALVVLRFVRRGEVVAALTLRDVVRDRALLRPTASHLRWRNGEGFDAVGRFVVETTDGVRQVFEVATGQRVDVPPPPTYATDLDRLAAWMTGTFSSAAQSQADPEYVDVRLHLAPVWSARTDGRWFYVEQAIATALDKPYRQRVYRLRALADGLFESKVFELPDPTVAVGAWKQPDPLATLDPAALVDRPGCAVLLRAVDAASFAGSTLGSQCLSTFRGATYATSEVTVTATGLVSWDRGYDAAGKQVWGAAKGGYKFDRVTPGAPDAPPAK